MDETEMFHQDTACKTLRACGLTRKETHQVLNTIQKWNQCSGPEWTVSRLKELQLWYIRRKAGDSEYVPSWHEYDRKDHTPLGIWGRIFQMKNEKRALSVLSVHTCFKFSGKPGQRALPSQTEKFLKAVQCPLSSTGVDPWWRSCGKQLPMISSEVPTFVPRLPLNGLRLTLPGVEIVTGTSVPLRLSAPTRLVTGKDRLDAYIDQWITLPRETVMFLNSTTEGRNHIPKTHQTALKYGMSTGTEYVGAIACIQEASLKARWIANPNRVTQHYLGPLGDLWYTTLKGIPSDCTFNQEAGIHWIQKKLKEGRTLVGFDLSSATDRLSMTDCIDSVNATYYGIPAMLPNERTNFLKKYPEDDVVSRYFLHLSHFENVSRGKWYGGGVGVPDLRWTNGQPLGTYPSFALLGLAHNAFALRAAQESKVKNGHDSFRIIGDDIIMDEKIAGAYERIITTAGGLINHQKSLRSRTICEFAGRLVTEDSSIRKNFKYLDPSDNSFMEIVSYLGPQAVGLLKPRQRQVYEQMKFVPGVIVEGGFPKDSFGEPLSLRYQWYLLRSQLLNEELIRDETFVAPQGFAERTKLRLQEVSDMRQDLKGRLMTRDKTWECLPFSNPSIWDDPHPKLADPELWKPTKMDPRLVAGKSFLERGEEAIRHPGFQPYLEFKNQLLSLNPRSLDSSNDLGPSLTKKVSPKSSDRGERE